MNDRRAFFQFLTSLFFYSLGRSSLADVLQAVPSARDNFRMVYKDAKLRDDFRDFLVHVYHLYPEDRLHALITELTSSGKTDAEIYGELQNKIPGIKPFFSEATYGLPALHKQKVEISAQTASLLSTGGDAPIRGYLEIGTAGRYVNSLKAQLKLEGPVYLVHDHEPALFNPMDVVERGQLSRVGTYIPLNDYASWPDDRISPESVDVVSNFIGLHHSPRERLDGFVRSICRALRPGGRFVLRDHDAHSRTMHAVVGLAHDVFNAGLGVAWEKNEAELRHFKPLAEIESYLAGFGLVSAAAPIYQAGDPTLNALQLFVKKS